jgi:hypothetical protein
LRAWDFAEQRLLLGDEIKCGSPGTPGSSVDMRLGAIVTVMAVAAASAVYGLVRIARSSTALRVT